MQGNNTVYYGVHVPNEQQIQENDGSTKVFCEQSEALKEVKKYKKARFKAFNYYHEALEFALYGCEHPNNNSVIESPIVTKTEPVQHVGEKPSQFRGPKSQDLVKFRKAIETGNLQLVQNTVWENPRYLISSGDTPAILQEGSRYNALHVAAKAKNAEMCELILRTVSSPNFIQMLYGEENKTNSEEGCKILLDLYLNTPDKGLNETPLHFAVKFGAVDVVEVLVSYPQCNKTVLNKYAQMPKDIVCNRIPPSPVLVNKIMCLLEDRYYVPVLRSEDNCVQPTIGEPFSPSSPPELNKNPINPRVEIHAYAGPMKREEAAIFRKKWKTPPRTPASPVLLNKFGSPHRHTPERIDPSIALRLQDTEKGLERVGRDLAKHFSVGWKEYWPFLGTFADFSSEDGLRQLENYIEQQYNILNESSNSIINKSEKSVSVENLTNLNNSNSSRSSVISPISDLCKNFEACTLSENCVIRKEFRSNNVITCLNRFNETVLDALSKSGLSPFLCIEKSCQVFANRIANHIMFLVDTRLNNTADALESEVKHLKSLIGSYMSDSRFSLVNFQSVHWRIGHLVAQKIKEIYENEDEINVKRDNLESIIKNYNKMADVFSSDDEELNNYRQPEKPMRRKSTSSNRQVICLIENILKALEGDLDSEKRNIVLEEDCIAVWSNALVCCCIWKTAPKSRKGMHLKKGAKFMNKNSNCRIMQNRSLDNVSRRLMFIEDEFDELESKGDSNLSNGLCEKTSPSIPCGYFYESSSSSDEDVFMDAHSQITSDNESDMELFEDARDEDIRIFLEGNSPTKMDYAVYTAIKDVAIDATVFPYVYRWKHTITLFPEEEKMSWPSPSPANHKVHSNGLTSTPVIHESPTVPSFTPPHSWLRITGNNSPARSLRALRTSDSREAVQNSVSQRLW